MQACKIINHVRNCLEVRMLKTLVLMFRSRTGNPKVIVYRKMYCNVCRNVVLEGNGRLYLGKRWDRGRYMPSEFKLLPDSSLRLEGYFTIYTGCSITVNPGAKLTLGSGYINNKVTIDCFKEVTIGQNVAISKGVTIRDSDNHSINDNEDISLPVRVGNHVWIGLNATILKGVTIGDGAVIAAGAVVTRNVLPHMLVGGVPARIIKENVKWT